MDDGGLRCVCGKKLGHYIVGAYKTCCRGCGKDVVFARPGRVTVRDQLGRIVRVIAEVTIEDGGHDDPPSREE